MSSFHLLALFAALCCVPSVSGKRIEENNIEGMESDGGGEAEEQQVADDQVAGGETASALVEEGSHADWCKKHCEPHVNPKAPKYHCCLAKDKGLTEKDLKCYGMCSGHADCTKVKR